MSDKVELQDQIDSLNEAAVKAINLLKQILDYDTEVSEKSRSIIMEAIHTLGND